MKLKQKLQNPFALIAQGFIAGAIILYATTPADIREQSAPTFTESTQTKEVPQA